jgi:TonB-dependent SusC/RagA subfamily outer membrane receptor
VTGGVFEMPHATHVLAALNVTQSAARSGSVIRPEQDTGGRNRSIGDLLNEVSGVQLIRRSGQVGQRYSLRIRGVRSFLFNGPPAIYVDGIRVSEHLGTGGVLDLLTTQDIGSVEVLRGPAAATVYGASASNGVILVTTRRGG